jgi:hypothetical protein
MKHMPFFPLLIWVTILPYLSVAQVPVTFSVSSGGTQNESGIILIDGNSGAFSSVPLNAYQTLGPPPFTLPFSLTNPLSNSATFLANTGSTNGNVSLQFDSTSVRISGNSVAAANLDIFSTADVREFINAGAFFVVSQPVTYTLTVDFGLGSSIVSAHQGRRTNFLSTELAAALLHILAPHTSQRLELFSQGFIG